MKLSNEAFRSFLRQMEGFGFFLKHMKASKFSCAYKMVVVLWDKIKIVCTVTIQFLWEICIKCYTLPLKCITTVGNLYLVVNVMLPENYSYYNYFR